MDDLIGPVERAAYDTVHEFRDPRRRQRGAVALAPMVGMQPGTLSNKVNPLQDTHLLGLVESIPLQLAASDYRILHAYAHALGHCAYELPCPRAEVSDMEVLNLFADFVAAAGRKAQTVRDALADRRVTPTEIQQVRSALDDTVRAGLELITRLEALG